MYLDSLAQSSIQGGIAILVLYVATRLFPAVPPKVRLWLWRLVFLKLLLGLLPLEPITLKLLPSPPEPVMGHLTNEAIPVAGPSILGSVIQQVRPASKSTPKENRIDAWSALYWMGALMFAGAAFRRARLFRNDLKTARPISDEALLANLAGLAKTIGRARMPLLMESDEIPTAVVTGYLNPTILLPKEVGDSNDVLLVLAHEMAHVHHRDLEWSGLFLVAQALYFFHPLVWIASRCYREAQESAADQAAIRLSRVTPRRYAEMLVRATVVARPSLLSASIGISMAGSTSSMKQRIKDMTHFNAKPNPAKIVVAFVLSAGCLAMVPGYRLAQTDRPHHQAKKPIVGQSKRASNAHARKTSPRKNAEAGMRVLEIRSGKKLLARLWSLPDIPGSPSPLTADLSIDNMPAHEAFKLLFRSFRRSLSLAPNVLGNITIFAHNVTFEQALRNMTGQIHATYRVVDGIYEIRGQGAIGVGVPVMSVQGLGRPLPPANHERLFSFKCNAEDVRAALKALFTTSQFSCIVDPNVQGWVTVDVNGVTLDTAVRNIVKQVNANFRTEGGVYLITKDAGAEGVSEGSFVLGPPERMHVRMDQVDVREAIRRIFRAVNSSYTIAPEVQGNVSLELQNVRFDIALENLVRQVDASFLIEGGVYNIVKKH